MKTGNRICCGVNEHRHTGADYWHPSTRTHKSKEYIQCLGQDVNYDNVTEQRLLDENKLRVLRKYGANQWQYRDIKGTYTVGLTKESAIQNALKVEQLHKSFIQCIGRDYGCNCTMSRRCDCGAPVGFMNLECDFCKQCVKEHLLILGITVRIETIGAVGEFKEQDELNDLTIKRAVEYLEQAKDELYSLTMDDGGYGDIDMINERIEEVQYIIDEFSDDNIDELSEDNNDS